MPDFAYMGFTSELVADTTMDPVRYLKPELEKTLGQDADFILVAVPKGEAFQWRVRLEHD